MSVHTSTTLLALLRTHFVCGRDRERRDVLPASTSLLKRQKGQRCYSERSSQLVESLWQQTQRKKTTHRRACCDTLYCHPLKSGLGGLGCVTSSESEDEEPEPFPSGFAFFFFSSSFFLSLPPFSLDALSSFFPLDSP